MIRAPSEIAAMSPQEAWNDGYRVGREELAAGMRRDEAAARSMEGIEAKLDLDNRLAGLELAMKLLADSDFDQAVSIADHSKRLAKLEGTAT